MTVVGLTGGIGSGKSTVAKMFEKLGVAIYIADEEAKKLMNNDEEVKEQVIDLFGEKAYQDSKLNRSYIADIVFNNSIKLQELNAIVHPAVAEHFDEWKSKQGGEYVIKEAAILFENGSNKYCDYVILVSAPEEIRIQRVLKRDKSATRKDVQARIQNQWGDADKINLSDFVIFNENIEETKVKVYEIHKILTCK